MLDYRGPRTLTHPQSERDLVVGQAGERMLMSQRAPVSGADSFSVLLPYHMQLCVHIPSRVTAADRGVVMGTRRQHRCPSSSGCSRLPGGWGLNPRCLFLTLCRPEVQLQCLLRTDRFPTPPRLHRWPLLPVSSPGRGREGERACSEPRCHPEAPPS